MTTRLTHDEITKVTELAAKLGEPAAAGRLGISVPTMSRACSTFESKPQTIALIRLALETLDQSAIDIEAANRASTRQRLADDVAKAKEAVASYKRRERLARKCGIFLNEIPVEEK